MCEKKRGSTYTVGKVVLVFFFVGFVGVFCCRYVVFYKEVWFLQGCFVFRWLGEVFWCVGLFPVVPAFGAVCYGAVCDCDFSKFDGVVAFVAK